MFRHLRSVSFNRDSDSIRESSHACFVELILNASPNLTHLAVAWRDFRGCVRTYPRLRHVELILQSFHPSQSLFPCKNGNPFDVLQLVQLAPRLTRLETSRIYLPLDADLPRSKNFVHIVPNLMKSYEILQEHRKGCASCNIVQESCGTLFNLTDRKSVV